MIQQSERVKIIKFVFGGFFIVLSGCHFFNLYTPVYVIYPGIMVLAIGIIGILKGILKKKDSKIIRSIETGVGISAIVVGLFIFIVFHDDVTTRSSWLFFLFIIIQGIGFILTGITQINKARAISLLLLVLGIIFILLTGLYFTHPVLSHQMIGVLLSIHLFLVGIEIIKGAIGDKAVKRSNL